MRKPLILLLCVLLAGCHTQKALVNAPPSPLQIQDIYGTWISDADHIEKENISHYTDASDLEIVRRIVDDCRYDPIILTIDGTHLITRTSVAEIEERYVIYDSTHPGIIRMAYYEDDGQHGIRGAFLRVVRGNLWLSRGGDTPILVFKRK